MARPKADATRQVATRISVDAWELLQVALLIEDVESMQDLLRPVIEEYAQALADQPEVRAIQGNVQGYRDRKRGIARVHQRDSGSAPLNSKTRGDEPAS